MNLTTTEPGGAVIANTQFFRTKSCCMHVEARLGKYGRPQFAEVVLGRMDNPVEQLGDAEAFRELAGFMTAIADELEARQ